MEIRPMAVLLFRKDTQMPGLTWSAKLDLCDTQNDIIQSVRDYLASLDYAEVKLLPPTCRPRKILTAGDLSSYAFELVRYECEEPRVAEAIHRLAAFFAHANIRMSQVLMKTNDEDDTERYRA
jgi:hypothetical protein